MNKGLCLSYDSCKPTVAYFSNREQVNCPAMDLNLSSPNDLRVGTELAFDSELSKPIFSPLWLCSYSYDVCRESCALRQFMRISPANTFSARYVNL